MSVFLLHRSTLVAPKQITLCIQKILIRYRGLKNPPLRPKNIYIKNSPTIQLYGTNKCMWPSVLSITLLSRSFFLNPTQRTLPISRADSGPSSRNRRKNARHQISSHLQIFVKTSTQLNKTRRSDKNSSAAKSFFYLQGLLSR